ncbi:MAG: RnfABCDGE type electron transport complex subunit D [Candidatus Pacebacteria bacterium]|nr:RnfABCDGE type electron transport complex subunit D [Candidatus Paceibacterota bacterium]
MNFIDNFLNRITMYRLVLYYLIALLGLAAVFGAFGILPYHPADIAFTALFLVLVAWTANGLLAVAFKAHPNVESAYITALILALIIDPGSYTSASFVMFLIAAGVLAMASKYILSLGKKHLFNPAAIAVVITALVMGQSASWWIGGNLPLMAFVIAGGFLIVRKIQRFDLALIFLAAAFVSDILTHPTVDPFTTIQKAVLHTPLFFFAAVMITEPLTTPPTRMWRIEYAALVGLIFSPAVHFGPLYSTPELALVIGNLFSYAVSPKGKQVLMLVKKEEAGAGIYDLSFAPEAGKPLSFLPGQYLEWTLAHPKADSRGNRRYFTIASSPTEKEVILGAKFYRPSSSFKSAMLDMVPGDTIVAGQLAGDFTMPRNHRQKLAFIAGGIGITPFRSMVKYLTDTAAVNGGKNRRDVVLLYSNRTAAEIAYRDVFDDAAKKIGMKTVYAVTQPEDGSAGTRITPELIRREIPDYRERMFYISGTHAMTTSFQRTLAEMGVPRTHIKIDFFPGFA